MCLMARPVMLLPRTTQLPPVQLSRWLQLHQCSLKLHQCPLKLLRLQVSCKPVHLLCSTPWLMARVQVSMHLLFTLLAAVCTVLQQLCVLLGFLCLLLCSTLPSQNIAAPLFALHASQPFAHLLFSVQMFVCVGSLHSWASTRSCWFEHSGAKL